MHAANSAATYRDQAAHFDMVRCGIAVYGLDPFHEDPARARARARAAAGVVRGRGQALRAGRERRLRAAAGRPSEPTWVGTLPIGYGDGWRRGLTNNADVLVGGRRYPLVGTVSMDNITIDLGPETDVEPGDRAVLIGEDGGERILCEEVARRLDTINYEITCGLTPRVRRVHEHP